MAIAPQPAPAFASSYVAVEQFNPAKYYNETGMTPRSLPTGTTGETSTQRPATPIAGYIPFVAIVILIWALESHKLGRFTRLLKK
jgi:hypothetical protein